MQESSYWQSPGRNDSRQQSLIYWLSLRWKVNTVYTVKALEAMGLNETSERKWQMLWQVLPRQSMKRLYGCQNFIRRVQRTPPIDDFTRSERSKLHPNIYTQHLLKRSTRRFDFQTPGWHRRGIPLLEICWNQQSCIQPVVKLQWFNLCGWKRLQSSTRRLYLGQGSGLETAASNQRIQTNISIKQDHTV